MSNTKEDVIAKVYNNPSGHGSIQNTYNDAKKINFGITIDNVKDWFSKNVERKTQLKGFNSYVAPEPNFEYQIDLFYLSDLEDQKSKVGMLAVDIFTKYTWVVPIMSKSIPDVLAGFLEIFHKMGKPKMVYSDNETSFVSPEVQKYFQEQKIKFITTRTHAAVAERQIQTIKGMIYKRLENSENKQWTSVLYPVLLTYNHKMIHRTTGMTPDDARKKENHIHVKTQLEIHRITKRRYPDINIGDSVKVYQKKEHLIKDR